MPIGSLSTTRSKCCVAAVFLLRRAGSNSAQDIIAVRRIFLAVSCSKDGRPEIYLKREDLNHTGAHKINNSLGQALLCRRMGKKRVIAETGAGQHGVATVSLKVIIPHSLMHDSHI